MPEKQFVAEIREEVSSEGRTGYWLVVRDLETEIEAFLYFNFREEVVARMAAWFNTTLRTTGQEAVVMNFVKGI